MNRSLLTVLPTFAAAAIALSACASASGAGPDPITPTERYRMTAVEHPEQLAFSQHENGLSDKQVVALDRLVAGWSASGGGTIWISAPEAGADGGARMAEAVRTRLQNLGVRDSDLHTGVYKPGQAGGPVLIAYTRYEAQIPNCSKSWTDLTSNANNVGQKNFGCALTANMAAQLENPRDIAGPRDAGPTDAARRETVLQKYRKGEPTAAQNADPNAGKVAAVD